MERRDDLGVPTPDVQIKDKQRAIQREKILSNIKNPTARILATGLLPNDGINTSVNAELLKRFAELLGKDTHTVLFGLAATSKNPTNLANALLTIVALRNVASRSWDYKESEDCFLGRPLPREINASRDAQTQATATRMGYSDLYPEYLLESLFYTVSIENSTFSPMDKKRILHEFYVTESLEKRFSFALVKDQRGNTYNPQRSFWTHVDGSWIYPNNEKKLTPDDALSMAAEITLLMEVTADLQARLDSAQIRNRELDGLMGEKQLTAKKVRDLERELNSARSRNQDLEILLRKAQQRQYERTEAPEKQSRKTPYQILEISPTATPIEIKNAWKNLSHVFHSDLIDGELSKIRLKPKAIATIKAYMESQMKEINNAYDELKAKGRVS